MLYRLFILTFLLLIYTNCAQATTFPEYKEVVEMLIRTTKTCKIDFQSSTKLNIEKRADGYWVSVAIWNFETLHYDMNQKQLFWSAEMKEYHLVTFEMEKANHASISNDNLLTPPSYVAEYDSYNMHPFFGYDGWYHDVISFYSNQETQGPLKDFELYSFARAYSNYAKVILSDIGTVVYALPENYLKEDKASVEQVKLYTAVENKAVHYFHQTYLKTPTWNTLVGNIFIKYSNELVTQYFTLSLHIKHKDALKVLKGKELYTEETLAFAANMLKSCPQNAVLWTYGDNTSLPMFYLQQVKGVRKDIVVTDAAQLSLWRYVNYLKNPKIHSKPVVLDIDPSMYYKDHNNYIFIKDSTSNLNIEDLKLALNSTQEKKAFNTKKIVFPYQGKGALNLNLEADYLLKNEWISLFIFTNNQRPFCFYTYFKNSNLKFVKTLGIKQHLHPFGFVHQLLQEEYMMSSDEELETSYTIITQQLEWPSFKEIQEEDHPSFHQYLWTVIMLANDLYNSNQQDKVTYLLDDFKKTFPVNSTTAGFNGLFYFIDLYFKVDLPTKAEIIIENNFKQLIQKEYLNKREYLFIQRVDTILQERKIDKFNKTIQQLYLKPNASHL